MLHQQVLHQQLHASKKLGALIEQQQNNFRTQNAAAMQTMETEGRALAPLLRGKTQQQWAADPVLKAKVEAQMRREQDLQQKEQLLKASAAQTERRVTQELDSKLAPIVDQLMTAHGAAVVLDANAVLKAKTGVDITDEALQKFNATVTTANVAWVAVTLQPAPTNPTTLPKK